MNPWGLHGHCKAIFNKEIKFLFEKEMRKGRNMNNEHSGNFCSEGEIMHDNLIHIHTHIHIFTFHKPKHKGFNTYTHTHIFSHFISPDIKDQTGHNMSQINKNTQNQKNNIIKLNKHCKLIAYCIIQE
jgi:hypothetical protein